MTYCVPRTILGSEEAAEGTKLKPQPSWSRPSPGAGDTDSKQADTWIRQCLTCNKGEQKQNQGWSTTKEGWGLFL